MANFGKCDLHIPHKDWSDDPHEAENYREIERWAARLQNECACCCDDQVIFDLPVLSNGLVADRYYSPFPTTLVRVMTSLTVTGSSNTIVTAKINNTTKATITLGSGEAVDQATLSPAALFRQATDYLDITCVTSGTGASGLVVYAVFNHCTPGSIIPTGC